MHALYLKSLPTSPRAAIDRYFAELGLGINPAAQVDDDRLREICQLMAQSDAALAAMGLSRPDIVAHVFRDRFATRA